MLHQANILIHVIAGLIAMLIAIVPYVSDKGGETHRRYGRIFLWLMGCVIITAINGVVFFRDRPFLTVVTLLSFYSAYSGYRVLKTKNSGFALIDFLMMLFVMTFAIMFLVNMQSSKVLWGSFAVYYILGYLFVLLGFDILRYFVPTLIKNQRFWLYEHIYKITGAFTALFSAGAGTVLGMYEPWNQIIPAILSTLWLIFCLWYFPKKNEVGPLV